MSYLFDLKRFGALLQDFNHITGLNGCAGDSNADALVTPEMSPICRCIRSCAAGNAACRQCDRQALGEAAARKGVYIYRCHAGLTEAIVPVFFRDAVIANLSFGMLLCYDSHEAAWQALHSRCGHLPVDLQQLQAACFAAPLIAPDYVRSAANLLEALASHVVLQRMFEEQSLSDAAMLDSYLRSHFREPLSVPQLCKALHLGKNQLFALCRRLYGHGPARQLRLLRLNHAKALLQQSSRLPLREIAYDCGFGDYNYFIRIFSQEFGCPPGAYRNTVKEDPQ